MNYADQNFYSDSYLCGRAAVITAAFDFYARKATLEIKKYILCNVNDASIPDALKNCCCEVAEILYTDEHSHENGVSSESVGGWSKSYENTESRKNAAYSEIRNAVYAWLSDSGLLYRGMSQCL